MQKSRIFIILVVPIFIKSIVGLNILALSPLFSPSHHNWNRQIYYGLAAKGYNVTVLSPDVDRETTKNLHYIKLEGLYEALYNGTAAFDLIEMSKSNVFQGIRDCWDVCIFSSEHIAKSKGLKALLDYPDNFKFDLLIIDLTIGPYLLGFLHKFNYPPAVAISAFSYPHYFIRTFGGHRHPAYIPFFDSEFPHQMTFFQRLQNLAIYLYDMYIFDTVFIPQQEKVMREIFKYKNLPNVDELSEKIGIALVNTHVAIEHVAPMPSNIIPVGGLQISNPKPLDQDTKKFIEAGKKGTVLFSLGTNVKSSKLSQKIKIMIIEVFRELPDYNFLWKYETDLDIPLPKNAKTLPWVRQNDILAHPNIKAFISHCGLMGTQEAIWHGVPVIGIPFFSDQPQNIQKLIRIGMAVKVTFTTISKESFKYAVKEVLENPEYSQNAKRRSRLFQDQPDKPLDRALFWLDWAMRHKDDVETIESPSKRLSSLVSNSYDIVIFIVILIFLVISAVIKCFIIFMNIQQESAKKSMKKTN